MKIAIKGHPNNGDKIIEYFISLGATNPLERNGMSNWYYYIEPCSNIIDVDTINHFQEYKIYESWEEFENTVLNKNKMEKRNIEISLEKAKEWYEQGGDLREVALQAFDEDELKYELEDKFPVSWGEYNIKADWEMDRINAGGLPGSANYCHFATKEEADAFVALGKLIQLRDEYWKLDNNWKPDLDIDATKYCIVFKNNRIKNENSWNCSYILAFRTMGLCDKFFHNFEDLIEQAKIFL